MDDRDSKEMNGEEDETPPRGMSVQRGSRYGEEVGQRESFPPPSVNKGRRTSSLAKKEAKSAKTAARCLSSLAKMEARLEAKLAGQSGRRPSASLADQQENLAKPDIHESEGNALNNSSARANAPTPRGPQAKCRSSLSDKDAKMSAPSEPDIHDPEGNALSNSSPTAHVPVPRVPKARRRASLADKEAKFSTCNIQEPEEMELTNSHRNSTSEPLNSLAPRGRPSGSRNQTGSNQRRPLRYRDKLRKYDDDSSHGSSANGSSAAPPPGTEPSSGHLTPSEDPEANIEEGDPAYDDEYYRPVPGAVSVSVSEGEVVGWHARDRGHLTMLNDPMDRPIDEQTFLAAAPRTGAHQQAEHLLGTADVQYLQREDDFFDEQPRSDRSFTKKPRWYCTMWFKILVAVAITAAVVIGVTSAMFGSDSSPESETVVSVDADTRREAARAVLSLVSDTELLDQEGTPQNMAFEWIVNEDQVSRLEVKTLGENLRKLTQRYVLAVFYYATGGESQWAATRNWLGDSVDECDWKYITCSTDGEVTTINTGTSGNRITGALPKELGVLSSMLSMVLRGNAITDIPDELRSLTNLVYLRLDKNALAGYIPPAIYHMTSLESLLLGENALAGTISPSIANLSKLTNLDLFINMLSGTIPSLALSSVRKLTLASNNLEGNVEEILPGMTNLVEVDLSHNNFVGTIPSEVGTLLNLDLLILDHLDLSSSIPSELGLVTGLRTLALIANGLTGTVPTELNNLSNLETLQLSFNFLTGSIPDRVCSLRPPGGDLTIIVVDCSIDCECCTTCI